MKRVDREGPIHRSIVAYLHAVLPHGSIIHHSPNEGVRGGARGKLDGARRKAMGQLAGYPDLQLWISGQGYCIEVKAPGGYQSEPQKMVQELLEAQGVPYAVCRSVDDVRAVISEWGIETKEAAA